MSEQTEKSRETVSETEKKTGANWWVVIAKEIAPYVPLIYNVATKNTAGIGSSLEGLQRTVLNGQNNFETIKNTYDYVKNYFGAKKYERTPEYLTERKGQLKRELKSLSKQETNLLQQKGEAKTKEEKKGIEKQLKPVLKEKEEKSKELNRVEKRMEKVNIRVQKEADKKLTAQEKTAQNKETAKKVFNGGKTTSEQSAAKATKENTAAKSAQQQTLGRKR